MGKARSATIAAVIGSLVLLTAAPADAADTPLILSTGLTDGQYVNARQSIRPTFGPDAVKADLLVNGAVALSYDLTRWNDVMVLRLDAGLNDTDADVTIRAHDASDATVESTVRVHVDTDAPHATFTPAADAIVHGVDTITASDVSSDTIQIAMYGRNNTEVARALTAPWTLTWDTTNQPGRVRFAVTDRAGNVTEFSRAYVVDNYGPDLGLESGGIPSLLPPVGEVFLQVWPDDVSGVDRLEWWIGGALRGTSNTLWYDFGRQNRTTAVEVRAWDKLGNESVSTVDVRVDASGPAVTSITPAQGTLIRGRRITSTITATDPSGIQWATLSGAVSDFSAPYTSSVPAGRDGTKILTWYVVDNFLDVTTVRRTVIVDNTKPALKIITAPKNGAKVRGTVKVTASASDRNGVNRVELLINGKVVAKDTKARYRFSINTKKYGKKFKVQIRAYDRAGNSTTTTARTWHR
jgi:hypothetical protein